MEKSVKRSLDKSIRLLDSVLSFPGIKRKTEHGHKVLPGEMPGIEHMPSALVMPEAGSVEISYIDYCAAKIESGEITDVDDFLSQPVPEWVAVRWINISNMHPYVINQFRRHFEFHTLTAEDVLHSPQRPRVETFDDHLFVVLRMLQLAEHDVEGGRKETVPNTEQVSLFLYDQVLMEWIH